MTQVKCSECDLTMEGQPGWVCAVRHVKLFGAVQHELVLLTKEVESVKEIDA